MNFTVSKLKEIFLYLFFGVLTTFICLACYYALVMTVLDAENPIQLQAANIIAWFCAVIFAFFTNRKYVFNGSGNIISEIIKFFLARIFSLLLDMLIMFLFVSVFKYNDKIIKVISQIIIVVSNYLLSKCFVFKD
ncbi:GtrA family protein [Treponema sp. C6A8]|uniref:GtrA family protein n=1 Tax=Treponema sp. C6A8 TaxID=1410609 RepID=UPI0004854031|nr:GtrA family protein [Treponema sp. C6A8]